MYTYYISSGAKNMLYTLRVESKVGMYIVDNYVRILANDPYRAVENACKYLNSINSTYKGEIAKPDFALGDISRIRSKPNQMPFGKYKGADVEDLIEVDPNYCVWFVMNCGNNEKAQLVIDFVKMIMPDSFANKLLEKQLEESDKKLALAKKQEWVKELGKKYGEILKDGKFGFCDSIGSDLIGGVLPYGRGFTLMLEILAKRVSGKRKNSKEYVKVYNELEVEFTYEEKIDVNIDLPRLVDMEF